MPDPRILRRLPASILLALYATSAFGAQDDPRHAEIKDLDDIVVRATPLPRTAEDLTRPALAVVAAPVGDVRLIDNLPIPPRDTGGTTDATRS